MGTDEPVIVVTPVHELACRLVNELHDNAESAEQSLEAAIEVVLYLINRAAADGIPVALSEQLLERVSRQWREAFDAGAKS